MDPLEEILQCTGFQWDEWNIEKNRNKHNVSPSECEEVFFNDPLLAGVDDLHSQNEFRYFALGQTDGGRELFIVLTIRNQLIRVISARDMTLKERKTYAQLKKENLDA